MPGYGAVVLSGTEPSAGAALMQSSAAMCLSVAMENGVEKSSAQRSIGTKKWISTTSPIGALKLSST